MTQFIGNSAVVASGDGSIAVGDDFTNTEIDTDIEVGDIWIDNEWTTDSFNDDFSDNWSIDDSFQDNSTTSRSTSTSRSRSRTRSATTSSSF